MSAAAPEPSRRVEHIKGSVVESYLQALEARIGKAAYAEVLGDLDEQMKATLTTMHAAAWVPEQLLCEIIGSLLARRGVDDVRASGYAQQLTLMKRTHTFFARLAGPQNLVRIAARAWGQFRDTGKVTSEMLGDKGARMRLEDNASMRQPGCAESFIGSCVAMLEVTRAKNVRGSYSITEPAVIFEFHWE